MNLIYPCKSRRITSFYGFRGSGFHNGLDIGGESAGVAGDRLISCFTGTVSRSYLSSSYGECVVIDHDVLEISILYAHLLERKVNAGDKVKHGQLIGLMGTTGYSTGVHLHFEVRDQRYKDYSTTYYKKDDNGQFLNSIDPMKFLQESDIFTTNENKILIQGHCKFSDPNGVWKHIDKHPYDLDLYRKLRESYEEV